jgi:hypothetical protein
MLAAWSSIDGREFCDLQNVQTGAGAHPTLCL